MQRFNYHSHTFRCKHADLNYLDEDYVLDYIKMGFKKIAFTDHIPQKNPIDLRPTVRMDYNEKDDYLKSIKNLKKKYSNQIEIESGFEFEYLPGEEENIKELKKEVDKLVLGQHFIYDDNNNLKIFNKTTFFEDYELKRYAEYICNAMELGLPDIIVHPDIFMLERKNFGEIESEITHIICAKAEECNIPLEINLNRVFLYTYFENQKLNNIPFNEQKKKLSKVEYPCKEFWEIASNYNVKVLYGLDAHNRGQIPLWHELIKLANEVIGEDTINKLNFIKY